VLPTVAVQPHLARMIPFSTLIASAYATMAFFMFLIFVSKVSFSTYLISLAKLLAPLSFQHINFDFIDTCCSHASLYDSLIFSLYTFVFIAQFLLYYLDLFWVFP
jgi:hypothetical protein